MRHFRAGRIGGALVWGCANTVIFWAIACDGSSQDTSAADAAAGTRGTHPVYDATEPLPGASLSVNPGHETTANDGAVVRVVAFAQFGNVDTSWLERRVTLEAGAPHTPVPFAGALAPDETGFSYSLTPASPLSPGWYSVVLAPPGNAFRVFEGGEGTPAGPVGRNDGTYESRFRVGSSPLLLAVAACASTELSSLPKLILSFSEPVDLTQAPPVRVSVDGNAPHCTVYDAGQTNRVGFTCTPEMPASAAITVSITEGIVALGGGAALHDAAGATSMTLELPPAAERATCRTWRETRETNL